ncbi:MAG TPA: antibiotic biosynthesis monooxygenase family protein [Mycobacteriales bacterium]
MSEHEGPVTEHAVMQVDPARAAEFEAVLPEAIAVLTGSAGCRSARVSRRVEAPGAYLLLVEWDSLADHVDGFRGSPAFDRWRSLVRDFWVELPTVEHFTPLVASPPS